MARPDWGAVGSPQSAEMEPAGTLPNTHTIQRKRMVLVQVNHCFFSKTFFPGSSSKLPSADSGPCDGSLLSHRGHVRACVLQGRGHSRATDTHRALLSCPPGGRDMDLGSCPSVLRPSESTGLLPGMRHGCPADSEMSTSFPCGFPEQCGFRGNTTSSGPPCTAGWAPSGVPKVLGPLPTPCLWEAGILTAHFPSGPARSPLPRDPSPLVCYSHGH